MLSVTTFYPPVPCQLSLQFHILSCLHTSFHSKKTSRGSFYLGHPWLVYHIYLDKKIRGSFSKSHLLSDKLKLNFFPGKALVIHHISHPETAGFWCPFKVIR